MADPDRCHQKPLLTKGVGPSKYEFEGPTFDLST
jgi:hypothetical protein